MQFGAYLIEPPQQAYTGPADIALSGQRSGQTSITSPGFLRDYARHAEGLGFDSIWFPDHVVLPSKYESRYPYQTYEDESFKRYPFDETAFPEPFTALAYVAGATERLKLRTGILILPERNPVLFAKQLATLDAISGGRLELGIGIGWLREEFEALGIPWRNRGKRTDECIEAMRALWRDDVASYHGETVSFDGIRCTPKPTRPEGVPLIIGGHSAAAARRAGRYGQGFMPLGFHQESDGWEFIEPMREAAREAGRNPDDIELCAGAPPDADYIEKLAEHGVSHVYFVAYEPSLDESKATLERIAETVFPRFR